MERDRGVEDCGFWDFGHVWAMQGIYVPVIAGEDVVRQVCNDLCHGAPEERARRASKGESKGNQTYVVYYCRTGGCGVPPHGESFISRCKIIFSDENGSVGVVKPETMYVV